VGETAEALRTISTSLADLEDEAQLADDGLSNPSLRQRGRRILRKQPDNLGNPEPAARAIARAARAARPQLQSDQAVTRQPGHLPVRSSP